MREADVEQEITRDSRLEPLLALQGITKHFPGCLANDAVSLDLRAGEIHALLGENGAGKSTLVKIIYGVLKADQGDMLWQGKALHLEGPAEARRLGIGMVFQHFSLFEALSVLENIALALPPSLALEEVRARSQALSQRYGLKLALDAPVWTLSVGERQRIEILRCLLQDPKLLILDEPTSVLTPQEVEGLFDTLRALAEQGCALCYISHKLDEVKALCSQATVLRAGKVVARCDPRQESAESLAEMMIGQRVKPPERQAAAATATSEAAPRLVAQDLVLPGATRATGGDTRVSFTLAAGEILGIAGIAGNGQDLLLASLIGESGARGHPESLLMDGAPVGHLGPEARRLRGAAFVPEERIGKGAVPSFSLTLNAFLTSFRRLGLIKYGFLRETAARALAREIIQTFDVRTTGPEVQAASLSGGNLQKFIVGREIKQIPGLLVVSQPTWGVDAGAAAFIHQTLLDLASQGTAILVISQDLDEIFALSDRIAVLSQGHLSPPRTIAEVSLEQIGLLMGATRGDGSKDSKTEEAQHAGA